MKLSIVTINYNNALGLEKTIESVIQQTWRNFEYIVIDGGSNDESVEIIRRYERNLHYWISEKDGGIYHAMNKGISVAIGEYILMLNSGDCLYNNEVLQFVFDQNNFSADIIYGNVQWINKNTLFVQSIFPAVLTFQFFWNRSLGHQAAFIKKSIHSSVGLYDETLQYCSDWKFFVLAICKFEFTYQNIKTFVSLCDSTGLSWNAKNFSAMNAEKNKVLQNDFSIYYDDYVELMQFKDTTKKKNFQNLKQRVKENIKVLIGFRKNNK